MTARSHRLLALLLLVLPSCVGSPQPSPPNLNGEGVRREGDGADIRDGILLEAEQGTVTPPEGSIVVVNLDEVGPPVSERVQADGSFMVSVDAMPTDELRLQVRNGGARSVPLDVIGRILSFELEPAPRPLEGCLTLGPAYELDLGEVSVGEAAEGVVVIENGCPDPVVLSASLRDPAAPVSFDFTAGPLDAGASTELTVRFTPPAAGSAEAIVFVEATAPMRDRRPLTLFVRGRD